jgi:hypothetical protein
MATAAQNNQAIEASGRKQARATTANRQSKLRTKRTKEGLKPVTVWLPEQMISQLDGLRGGEIKSRDKVFEAVFEGELPFTYKAPSPPEQKSFDM